MVLAEAMAAHVPVVAAASGAIPEVVGASGTLFPPGDWVGLAGVLAGRPARRARRARGARPSPSGSSASRAAAAAARLRAAYEAGLALTADVVVVTYNGARALVATCLEHLAAPAVARTG